MLINTTLPARRLEFRPCGVNKGAEQFFATWLKIFFGAFFSIHFESQVAMCAWDITEIKFNTSCDTWNNQLS